MLQNKKIVALLSIVLAMMMWIYVIEDVNPVINMRMEDVKVKILNREALSQRDLALVGDGIYKIDITVKGKRSDLVKLSKEDLVATADVFGYSIGQNAIPVNIKLPDNIKMSTQNNHKIVVEIEELVSLYKNIEIKFLGKIKKGKEVIIYENAPWEVEVKGAKSNIAKVKKVVAEVDKDLVDNNRKMIMADLKALDGQGKIVKDLELSSDVVEIDAGMGMTKEVALNVDIKGNVGKNLEITNLEYPEKVLIKGTKEKINKIEKVEAIPIDITEIKTTTEIPIKIKLPEGVQLSYQSEEPTVKVVIKGIVIKNFTIENNEINGENLKEGLSLVINTPSVHIKASGIEDTIQSLIKEDLQVYIDLKDKEAGIDTVPVQIKNIEGIKEFYIEPEDIHITINESI